MTAAFDEHDKHRNVYPYCAVTYWAFGAEGMHSSTPDDAWDVVKIEPSSPMSGNYAMDWDRENIEKAYRFAQFLELAYIAGLNAKALEVRKVLYIKDPR